MELEKTILEEAQRIVYGERESAYGTVTENFTTIAKGWSLITKQEITPEQVGLMMVWLKMARQMNKHQRDNLIDGAGYFATIEKLQNGL